jgi:ribonuclease HI
VYPLGSIVLPVTFGTGENFRTENVQFDVAEVNLPFNAIIGRPALYWFMAIAHYGYLVLKMPSPAGVLSVRGDRTAALAAVQKLHALAAETPRPGGGGRSPSASGAKAPKVQPTEADGRPAKTIQVGADPSRTTRIAGNLGEK